MVGVVLLREREKERERERESEGQRLFVQKRRGRVLVSNVPTPREEAIIGREFGLSEETESVDQTHAQWALSRATYDGCLETLVWGSNI